MYFVQLRIAPQNPKTPRGFIKLITLKLKIYLLNFSMFQTTFSKEKSPLSNNKTKSAEKSG